MKYRFFAVLAALCAAVSLAVLVWAAEGAAFRDVDAGSGYAEAVAWAAERGYVNGYADGRFGVDDPVSRAQLAAMLHRAAGSSAASGTVRFSDVRPGAYYMDAVGWAADSGLVNGYADGRFGVDDSVSRQQVVTILWRWMGSPDAAGADYVDEKEISAYAGTAVDWSRTNQIMAGREDGRFAPGDSATRGEVVSALYQYMRLRTSGEPEKKDTSKEAAMPKLRILAGGQTFTATLEDNPTTRAMLDRLPFTATMNELNGNEKYYYLTEPLPTDAQRPGTIHTGDLMLFGADCLVLFYETFSSGYSYTRLGSVDNPSGLSGALGGGSVEVTFQTIR